MKTPLRTTLDHQFRARGNDHRDYVVEVWKHIGDRSTPAGRRAEASTDRSLRTSIGHVVKRLDKGRYTIVDTGVVLESGDPGAP